MGEGVADENGKAVFSVLVPDGVDRLGVSAFTTGMPVLTGYEFLPVPAIRRGSIEIGVKLKRQGEFGDSDIDALKTVEDPVNAVEEPVNLQME